MSTSPRIYFLGSSFLGQVPLEELDPTLEIPLERKGTGVGPGFPLVQYFEGIKAILEKDGFRNLLGAIQKRLGQEVSRNELREVLIYSEKHGSDYHPAKIEIRLPNRILPFAMNVSLHRRRLDVLFNEFNVLIELKRKFGQTFLPAVYFLDEIETTLPRGERAHFAMYLADWFEGYYEFHLSRDPADGQQKLVLWDTAAHNHYLPSRVSEQIYREMSRILTSYYDLSTFAQIHPWHLAAGDFIARLSGDRVEVRLVAARQYSSLVGPPDLPPEEALLFFFLNLTLRLRLDRLDGVGEMAWAGSGCLGPIFEGFFLAMDEKRKNRVIPDDFVPGFRSYLNSRTLEDLDGFLSALADSGPLNVPDLPILRNNLDQHSKQLLRLIRETAEIDFFIDK